MRKHFLHFGVDFGFNGPRVVANLEGMLLPLDPRLFAQLRDPWLVPVYPAGNDLLYVPDFYTIKSLLGRTENLNFGSQRLRKPHFVFREAFALLKRFATEGFGRELGQVIVGTSAFYPEMQRHYLLQCAKQAGINNVHLIDDNVACALNFIDRLDHGSALLMNLGFERCEATLVELNNGKISSKGYQQSLKASGLNLSSMVLKSILLSLSQQQGQVLSENLSPSGWLSLFELSEQSRINIALLKNYEIFLERSLTGLDDHLSIKFNSNDFNAVFHAAFEELNNAISHLLSANGVSEDQIKKIMLSGGGANIPLLRNSFMAKFGNKLSFSGERVEAYGCARWARIVADEDTKAVAPELPALPEISEEQRDSSLIRGTVQVLDQETATKHLRRAELRAEGASAATIVELVREKAEKFLQVADRQGCARYLQQLDEIITEFKPKAKVATSASPTKTAAMEKADRTRLMAAYRVKIEHPREAIKATLNEAANAATPQEQGILFDRAVNLSHQIELWARQFDDKPRLKAVVQVHSKSAKLLMQGTSWDGSEETVFILCNKWLHCALRTIHENRLEDATEDVRNVFDELYLVRIQYLISNDNKDEAVKLKHEYVNVFGEKDDFAVELNRILNQPSK